MKLGLGQTLVSSKVLPTDSFVNEYSMDFDGVNDSISFITPKDIGETPNISYSVWVNLDVTTKQYIAGNWLSSNGGTGLTIQTGDVLIFQMADGTNDSFFNSRVANFSTYAPINTWNHILATWDGTDSKIYINGVLRNTWTPPGGYTISGYSTTGFKIGWRGQLANSTNGKLDEIGLFDSGVSISDVWDGSGKPIDISGVSGITHNWRMGDDATFDGTNWTIPDIVGSKPGTSANMDISDRVGDVPPTFNFKSLVFDGVNDYLRITPTIPIGLLSISFWMKSTDLLNGSVTSGMGNLGFIAVGAETLPILQFGSANYQYFVDQRDKFDGQWHHWFILTTGSAQADILNSRLFVNGIEIAKGSGNASGAANAPGSGYIGKGQYGPLACYVDEFAVWQSDETSNIATIYNLGIPNDISSLNPVSWWRMGEDDTFPTITDIGSGSSNGTMINMDASDIVTDVPT